MQNMNWNDYFACNAESGHLIWKPRHRDAFGPQKMGDACATWNKRFSGKIAGSKTTNAHRTVAVNAKAYMVHRVIWEMVNGPIPNGLVIDHINGNPSDNRLCNLRLCHQRENVLNSPRGIAKLKGVYTTRQGNPYTKITVNKKVVRLGVFPSKGLAAVAYAKASLRYHGKFSPYYRKEALTNANN